MRIFNRGPGTGPSQQNVPTHPQPVQRYLLRASFLAVACTTAAYAMFRIFTNDPGIVLLHLTVSATCVYCSRRVETADNLNRWSLGLLLSIYTYVVAIMAIPRVASPVAFAWAYLLPVASYLLLGRRLGFVVAVPFMAIIAISGLVRLFPLESEADWLLLMDATAIGALTLFFVHCYETSRAKDYAALENLAHTDPLTGLLNRRSFMAALEQTIHESKRSNIGFALVIMDIDHFKEVNDGFGHHAGDRALHHLARQLMLRLRKADSAGRLGGDEFGLILRGIEPEAAYQVVDQLRRRAEHHEIPFATCGVAITTTSGIAHWPHDARSTDELYQIADRRLYEGKRDGRNITISGPMPNSS